MLAQVHGWARWLVAVLLIVALIANLSGWLGGRRSAPIDRAINSGLLGVLGLQLLLGLALLVGKHDGKAMEHGVTMLLAVGLAHLSLRWRGLPDALRFRNTALLQLVVLALVYAGVWRITGNAGWLFGAAS